MRYLLFALLLPLSACSPPESQPAEPADAPAPEPLRVVVDSLIIREPDLRYAVAVAYPQIEGTDAAAVGRINRAIRDSVAAFADGLRPNPEDFTGDPEMDRLVVAEVEGGPQRTFLGGGIFSSRVDLYAYTGGAHGNLFSFPMTYDLATGEPIRFGDLFRRGTAYLDTLAALTTEHLTARQGTGWMFEDEVPAEPGSFALFTLGADSLSVFFPPYSIAPYAAGASEATLPYAALRNVASPSGPLARLMDDG